MRRSVKDNRFKMQNFLIFIVFLYYCIPAFAQSETTNSAIQSSKERAERIAKLSVWRVGIKEAPPFSYKDSPNKWSGISVALWRWVAQDVGLTYKFEEHDLQGLLDGVSRGDLDVAVGALTITAEREKRFDFSHSFFSTGLRVAVKKEPGTGFVSTLRQIMRGEGLRTMGVILLTLALITVLIFFCEPRYAILVHCKSEEQAKWIKTVIEERLKQCGLELHPEKTKIVYCKDSFRKGNYPNEKFDFLGYTFRPRRSKDRYGKFFVSFLPAVSDEAAKSLRRTIRGWRMHRMSDKPIKDLACMFNPIIRGWINYYGQFYKSALYPIFNQLNGALQRWAMRKYKKLRRRRRRAFYWLGRIAKQMSYLFAHWRLVRQSAGR
jgi:hypothetical protein